MHASEPAIIARGLEKRYGSRRAVTALDLDIPAGQLVALLGPNGAGKTTTVELIAGLKRPDAGSVTLLGHDPWSARAAVTRLVGVMLQEGGAYQAATPREMLRLYAALHADARDVAAVLADVDLSEAADQAFRTLSGGQKQRLNLALALVGRPRLLLLDEPTAGMDPAGRRRLWELLRGLASDGVTLLVTTHLMPEAEEADRVLVLARGRLVADDHPDHLTADAHDHVVVTTSATVDGTDLATGVGAKLVEAARGRYVLAGDAARLMVDVPAWFGAHGLPLRGVGTGRGGMEAAYLALVAGDGDDEAQADEAPGSQHEPGAAGPVRAGRADLAARRRRWRGGGPNPGRLRRIAAQTALELRLQVRNGETLLATLALPLGLLVFFGLVEVLPRPEGSSAIGFLTPGILGLAVIASALVSQPIATAFERQYLVLKRLGATPLTRGELVAAKAASILIVQLGQVAAILATAALLGWRPQTEQVWLVVPALLLGTSAFTGLGMAAAGSLRAVGTLALVNGLFVVLLLTSGILFPLAELGDAGAVVARVLPGAPLVDWLRAALAGAALPAASVLSLSAWAVAGPLLAALLFRWE